MTPEDLAWVQTRLKNCTNVRHQLKICAECLCTKQSDLLVRGERALFGVVSQDCVDALNNAAGVTRAQAAAMYGGAMYGWNSPMANPKNYSDTGSYIGPEMENANGEE